MLKKKTKICLNRAETLAWIRLAEEHNWDDEYMFNPIEEEPYIVSGFFSEVIGDNCWNIKKICMKPDRNTRLAAKQIQNAWKCYRQIHDMYLNPTKYIRYAMQKELLIKAAGTIFSASLFVLSALIPNNSYNKFIGFASGISFITLGYATLTLARQYLSYRKWEKGQF